MRLSESTSHTSALSTTGVVLAGLQTTLPSWAKIRCGPAEEGYTPTDADKDKILLMELPSSDIKWTEPRDIAVDEAVKIYRDWKDGRNRMGFRHLSYITLSGKYHDIVSIPNEETFRKMLTVEKAVVEKGVKKGGKQRNKERNKGPGGLGRATARGHPVLCPQCYLRGMGFPLV